MRIKIFLGREGGFCGLFNLNKIVSWSLLSLFFLTISAPVVFGKSFKEETKSSAKLGKDVKAWPDGKLIAKWQRDTTPTDEPIVVASDIAAAKEPRVAVLENRGSEAKQVVSVDGAYFQDDLEAKQVAELAPAVSIKPEDVMDMNFEGSSLASIVQMVAGRKGLSPLYIHKNLEGVKISLQTNRSMSVQDAWNNLMALLNAYDFVYQNTGVLHEFIPGKNLAGGLFPLYSSAQGMEPEDLPNNQEVVRYIYFLKNLKTDLATTVLNNFLSEKPQTLGDLNVLIMRDRSLTIKQAMKIIKGLDVGGIKQTVKVVPLSYADVDGVAHFLNNELIGDMPGKDQERIRFLSPNRRHTSYFSSDVRIIANRDRGVLLLLGQEEEVNRIIDFIKTVIDVDMGGAKSRLHIKELLYQDPGAMKSLLKNLTSPSGTASGAVSHYFKDLVFSAESGGGNDNMTAGNRLVVACNPEDWPRIEYLLDALDQPHPQIALEIMIVDATANMTRLLESHIRDTGYGVLGDKFAWRAYNNLNPTSASIAQNASNAAESSLNATNIGLSSIVPGASFTTFSGGLNNANDNGIWGILKALVSQNNASIISQPFGVVNNGEKFTEVSSDNVRVQGALSISYGRTNQQKEYASAKTNIEVTPRINAAGLVDLDVNIGVGEFLSQSATSSRIVSRTVKTRATMALGEVLVLGGFTQSTLTRQSSETPILSKIPIFGALFRGRQKRTNETEVYVFIRPSVIKPLLRSDPDDYTMLKVKYARYQIENANTYAKSKDPVELWMFKPSKHSIYETIRDYNLGRFPLIDSFVERRDLPFGADLRSDQFYRSYRLSKAGKKGEDVESLPEEVLAHSANVAQEKQFTPSAYEERHVMGVKPNDALKLKQRRKGAYKA